MGSRNQAISETRKMYLDGVEWGLRRDCHIVVLSGTTLIESSE